MQYLLVLHHSPNPTGEHNTKQHCPLHQVGWASAHRLISKSLAVSTAIRPSPDAAPQINRPRSMRSGPGKAENRGAHPYKMSCRYPLKHRQRLAMPNNTITRWTVSVSRQTDMSLRTFLAQRGMKKSDPSKFIEAAIKWRLLDQTMAEARAGFSDMPGRHWNR